MHYHYRDPAAWQESLAAVGFRDVNIVSFWGRRRHVLYNLMNYEARLPSFYPCEKMIALTERHSRFAAWATWATAWLSHLGDLLDDGEKHPTHFFITARKPVSVG